MQGTSVINPVTRKFFLEGLALDVRSDGRPRVGVVRPVSLTTSTQAFVAGSCHVRNGECDITIAVTSDIIEASAAPGSSSEQADADAAASDSNSNQTSAADSGVGSIQFEVRDSSPNSSPGFERNLEAALASLYKSKAAFDRKQLYIGENRAFALRVAIQITRIGGNLASIASLGVKAALLATRLPTATVTMSNDEVFVTVNKERLMPPLKAADAPILIAVHVCGDYYYVDATLEEEAFRDSTMVVGFAGGGRGVLTTSFELRKASQPGLHRGNVQALMKEASAVGEQLQELVSSQFAEQ